MAGYISPVVTPFTVPVGVSHEIYLWTMGGDFSPFQLPTLPPGMTIETSFGAGLIRGDFSGVAVGALAPGNYSATLAFTGYAGSISIAVYGISNDSGFGFEFASQGHTTSLSLPSGAALYLGTESTAGTYALTSDSFTTIDEQTVALYGGMTGLIGRQSSNLFALSTTAVGYGIAAVGIYPGFGVTFNETGLPAGTPWSASMNGSTLTTNGSALTYYLSNGTYPFTVAGQGCYAPSPSSGSELVRGAPLTVNVSFSLSCSTVTFQETGALPANTTWGVSLNGSFRSTRNATIEFVVPNGTYPFVVTAPACRVASPASGSVPVSGSDVQVNISFTVGGCYEVTFNETGLVPGTLWFASLGYLSNSSTTATIGFVVPNGTFFFSTSASGCYAAVPRTGTVVVHGGAVVQHIGFSGGPAGTTYPPTVALLACLFESPQGFIPPVVTPFTVPVGVSHEIYMWTMGGNFSPFQLPILPPGMTIVTSFGAGLTTGVFSGIAVGALAPGNYSATLNYTGYTGDLSVAVYGVSNDSGFGFESVSQGRTASLSLPSGATVYLASESTAGTYAVTSDSLTSIDVQTPAVFGGNTGLIGRQSSNLFTLSTTAIGYGIAAVGIYPGYAVTFNESGLPPGTPWSVSMNGSTLATNASTLSFYLRNGTYPFSVANQGCYTPTSASGTVNLSGAGAQVTLTFVHSPSCLTVRFQSVGLAPGSLWSVTTGASTTTNTTVGLLGRIVFGELAGPLSFHITPPFGYDLLKVTGPNHPGLTFANVTGPTALLVRFGAIEALTFTTNSVQAPGSWSVDLTAMTPYGGPSTLAGNVSGNGSVTFLVPHGESYHYLVVKPANYRDTPRQGLVTVPGHALSKLIRFALYTSVVRFTETGLSLGSTWGVNVTGPLNFTLSGTTPTFVLHLDNGSYNFTIWHVSGRTPAPASGSLLVAFPTSQLLVIRY